MPEILEIFNLKGKSIGFQERKDFYAEIKEEFKTKKTISKQVKAIRLLLMNSSGRMYLQKRSITKAENAGLYDKTIGGHVAKGENYNITAIRECAEELGFPASIVTKKEFDKVIKSIRLDIISIIQKVEEVNNFKSIRIDNKGNKFIQPYISTMYVGYYDGPIRFLDGESSGIETFDLNELKNEIKHNPSKFTEDLKWMINRYEKFLISVK